MDSIEFVDLKAPGGGWHAQPDDGERLGQPERDLGAVPGDPQRDHTAVLGDPDPVDQERDQVEGGQVGGQQLGQGPLGRGDEPARDR